MLQSHSRYLSRWDRIGIVYVPVTGNVLSKLVPVPAPPLVNSVPSGLYMYMLRPENVELFTPNPTDCQSVPANVMCACCPTRGTATVTDRGH